MKKVRVAVLGYGHLGKWHCQKVEALKDVAEFVAIVEKSPVSQESARQNHPHVKVVADLNDIITDIDAAVVVTPTSTHFTLVKTLLEKNLHVFCEKPLCSNDQEAQELKTLAKNKDLVIQVGHSERFHEAWEILKLKFHSLPVPFSIRMNRLGSFKGRATDVDVVQDLGIHDLDLLLYLFKQKPIKLVSHGQKIRTTKWDHVHIHLDLEEGCQADIVVGRNHVKEIRDLEVVSAAGTDVVDLFTNKIYEATSTQFTDGTFVKESSYAKRDHLLLEHTHFYESILKHTPAIIDIKDGIRAVHLVDLTLKSLSCQSPILVNLSHE